MSSSCYFPIIACDWCQNVQSSFRHVSCVSVFLLVDVGFEIPNRFVVGYALDYNEYFRDLNVSPESADTAAQSPWPFGELRGRDERERRGQTPQIKEMHSSPWNLNSPCRYLPARGDFTCRQSSSRVSVVTSDMSSFMWEIFSHNFISTILVHGHFLLHFDAFHLGSYGC